MGNRQTGGEYFSNLAAPVSGPSPRPNVLDTTFLELFGRYELCLLTNDPCPGSLWSFLKAIILSLTGSTNAHVHARLFFLELIAKAFHTVVYAFTIRAASTRAKRHQSVKPAIVRRNKQSSRRLLPIDRGVTGEGT